MKTLVVQVSPYPPEPGSDYHAHVAGELRRRGVPVVVLAGRGAEGRLVYPVYRAPRLGVGSVRACIAALFQALAWLALVIRAARRLGFRVIVHFHYGPTGWPGLVLGEQYPLGMILARLMGAYVVWTIHAMLTPRQVYMEARARGLPPPAALAATAYYMLVSLIAAHASNRVIVLVDTPDAEAPHVIGGMLARRVHAQVHPAFPCNGAHGGGGRERAVYCLGYIRREKAYHVIASWLIGGGGLLRFKIIGGVDEGRPADAAYARHLQRLAAETRGLMSVSIGRLDRRGFIEAVSRAYAVWCAYTGKYGPSGILAWARGCGSRPLCVESMWGGCSGGAPSFAEHVEELLREVYGC